MAQFYPQAPGSLFVAFYDSQGYDGDILTRLHGGYEIFHYLEYKTLPNLRRVQLLNVGCKI
jgi:hypothetical protein